MAEGCRIVRLLLLLFVLLVTPRPVNAQSMPEALDMNWLLRQPKYRNIHHDSFCRPDNYREIGNNALHNRPEVMAYETLSTGDIQVGIRNNCASNFEESKKESRAIKYIDTHRELYHITAIRYDENSKDLKVACYIQDIDNFYYVKLTAENILVCRIKDGREKAIYKASIGGSRLELSINKRRLGLSVGGVRLKNIKVGRQWKSYSLFCGLLFNNESISMVEDFIVDYPDRFVDIGVDKSVENDLVETPSFGNYCAEVGACTASDKYTKGSKRSYRFELSKPTQEQVDRNRNNALHSTVMLDCKKEGGYRPLDSFILSVDVLFPNEGDEAWLLDELFAEVFIQVHHAGYNIPFSPSVSININRGRMYLSTIWLEAIAKGPSPFDNDLNYRAETLGRLNSDLEESYLEKKGYGNYSKYPFIKKGEWHNILSF